MENVKITKGGSSSVTYNDQQYDQSEDRIRKMIETMQNIVPPTSYEHVLLSKTDRIVNQISVLYLPVTEFGSISVANIVTQT